MMGCNKLRRQPLWESNPSIPKRKSQAHNSASSLSDADAADAEDKEGLSCPLRG